MAGLAIEYLCGILNTEVGTNCNNKDNGVLPMKIQFHNLVFPEVSLNLGIAYMHEYRTLMFAFVVFSITICWAKEVKN